MDVSQRREVTQQMYKSSGGFELALSPVLLALVGLLIDRSLGITPILTVTFAVVGLAGVSVKLYYGYKLEMEQHEACAPWAKRHD
ncbi:AtpZ/AtpI family protein [Rhabdothermincola sediminis]|uniref:AtpZ/AtpI family protein n=1 Tax=Rhabdothermincola sediminis TaxID=2751370 RepID=UPI001AA04565|nr:AtpZ/AtpI family protein [Rhabdothermincola sediminis]